MIDFAKEMIFYLTETKNNKFAELCDPMFIEDEQSIMFFDSGRDGVIFTNKRILAINVQGLTGKKKEVTSLPYSKIQVYSVETAGTFDMDAELELVFSGLGKIKFAFHKGTDVARICKIISTFVL